MIILKIYSIIILLFIIVSLLINTKFKAGSFMMSVILFPILLYIVLN